MSTVGQAESGLGLEAQRDAIQAAARARQVELVAIFEDTISGAAGQEDRPGLSEAVSAIEDGDVLVVAKRDRLGRDSIGVALVERAVEKKGGRVISALEEGTNGDDPSSVFMKRILDAVAEYERLLIAARTRAALRAKKARGERTGTIPFGFREGLAGKLELDPREQEITRLAQALRVEGYAVREIVAELAARGWTGRTGRPLGVAQVHDVLKVPRMSGQPFRGTPPG